MQLLAERWMNMTTCILVEDNEVNRIITKQMLENLGLEVIIFDSAQTYLTQPILPTADVMLIDWHMPIVSGIEMLRIIRQESWGKAIPLYIYSSVEEPSSIQKALDAGADGFIPKPITIEKISQLFERLRII
jgi:two-component system, chemotaxis family, chemotaxis protein CheY